MTGQHCRGCSGMAKRFTVGKLTTHQVVAQEGEAIVRLRVAAVRLDCAMPAASPGALPGEGLDDSSKWLCTLVAAQPGLSRPTTVGPCVRKEGQPDAHAAERVHVVVRNAARSSRGSGLARFHCVVVGASSARRASAACGSVASQRHDAARTFRKAGKALVRGLTSVAWA